MRKKIEKKKKMKFSEKLNFHFFLPKTRENMIRCELVGEISLGKLPKSI